MTVQQSVPTGSSYAGVLRGFRSPDFRALARKATEQGWDLFVRGGGHVDCVSPQGTIVRLSATAHTAGPVLIPKRREFEKAGLVLSRFKRSKKHRTSHDEVSDMPKGVLLTREQLTEIAERRERGEKVKDIAAALGISDRAVSDHQPDYLKKPLTAVAQAANEGRRTVTDEQVEEIAEMRRAGMKIDDIAEKLGVSTATITKYQPDDTRRRSRYERSYGRSGPLVRIAPTPQVEAGEEADNETTESVTAIVARTNAEFGAYPIIRSLVVKQRRYAKMLQEAEALGDDDLQLVLMEKTKLSGIEAEAIRLWEATQTSANGNGNQH